MSAIVYDRYKGDVVVMDYSKAVTLIGKDRIKRFTYMGIKCM